MQSQAFPPLKHHTGTQQVLVMCTSCAAAPSPVTRTKVPLIAACPEATCSAVSQALHQANFFLVCIHTAAIAALH